VERDTGDRWVGGCGRVFLRVAPEKKSVWFAACAVPGRSRGGRRPSNSTGMCPIACTHLPPRLSLTLSPFTYLAWDTADVEARSTERAAPFHARHLHAQLARLDGGHVAAGATADDEQVLRGDGERAVSVCVCRRVREVREERPNCASARPRPLFLTVDSDAAAKPRAPRTRQAVEGRVEAGRVARAAARRDSISRGSARGMWE